MANFLRTSFYRTPPVAASGTPKTNHQNLLVSNTPGIFSVSAGTPIKKPMGFVKTFSFVL